MAKSKCGKTFSLLFRGRVIAIDNQTWIEKIAPFLNLDLYRSIKERNNLEEYLPSIKIPVYSIALCTFRCSS